MWLKGESQVDGKCLLWRFCFSPFTLSLTSRAFTAQTSLLQLWISSDSRPPVKCLKQVQDIFGDEASFIILHAEPSVKEFFHSAVSLGKNLKNIRKPSRESELVQMKQDLLNMHEEEMLPVRNTEVMMSHVYTCFKPSVS